MREADSTIQLCHILGRRTLLSLYDVELDAVAFAQRAEAVGLDRRLVHEAVFLPVFPRDEAEAFLVIEPLDRVIRIELLLDGCCVWSALMPSQPTRLCAQSNCRDTYATRAGRHSGRNAKRPARKSAGPIVSELVHARGACFA